MTGSVFMDFVTLLSLFSLLGIAVLWFVEDKER